MARSRLYRSRFLKVGPQVLIFQHFWDLHDLRTSAPLQTKEDSQTLTIFPSRFDQFGKTFAKIGERPTFAECGDIVDQFWFLFSFSDFAKSIKLLFCLCIRYMTLYHRLFNISHMLLFSIIVHFSMVICYIYTWRVVVCLHFTFSKPLFRGLS